MKYKAIFWLDNDNIRVITISITLNCHLSLVGPCTPHLDKMTDKRQHQFLKYFLCCIPKDLLFGSLLFQYLYLLSVLLVSMPHLLETFWTTTLTFEIWVKILRAAGAWLLREPRQVDLGLILLLYSPAAAAGIWGKRPYSKSRFIFIYIITPIRSAPLHQRYRSQRPPPPHHLSSFPFLGLCSKGPHFYIGYDINIILLSKCRGYWAL